MSRTLISVAPLLFYYLFDSFNDLVNNFFIKKNQLCSENVPDNFFVLVNDI